MEVRDPIHGFIYYNENEEKIINTEVFQRLRRIKQLSLANYVYPGATHTRFEHSLGVMHISGEICKRLEINEEKTKIIRMAALLHDIGHGPFSHVSEQVLQKFISNELFKKYKVDNPHELIGIYIIQNSPELNKIINNKYKDKIISLLQKENVRSIEKDIISSSLDADKLDYLLRDSYFTGVKYGIFDIQKILESLTKIPISNNERQLGIDKEGVFAVEQFLLANYHMRVQVYYHRIRRIVDAMLIKGLEFAIEKDRVKEIINIYKFKENKSFLKNYLTSDDEKVFEIILSQSSSKKISKKYFEWLRLRKLFKEIFSIEISSQNFDNDDVILKGIKNISEKTLNNIAEEVAKIFSEHDKDIRPEFIIVDKQSVSNPTFRMPGKLIDVSSILVNINKVRKDFSITSGIFSNPAVEPNKEFLYIYLPLNLEKEEREKLKKRYHSKILEIIKREVKNASRWYHFVGFKIPKGTKI